MVRCRYSPATARMPKTRVSSAARPTCASAWFCTAGSCTFPPDWTRSVTPARTSSGPAASSSQGPRTVAILRSSLRITGHTGRSPFAMSGTPARSVRQGGQVQERRLQSVARLADLAQRPGEAQLPGTDDHHLVDSLGNLAEHMAGHHDGPALAGQAAQQTA